MVHTHQTASVPVRQARPQAPKPAGSEAEHDHDAGPARPARPTTMPLKIFFTLMAISLIASSVLGLWIAFTSKRDRNLHVGLLVAGVILPIVLVLV
jgi:hypothetical protein